MRRRVTFSLASPILLPDRGPATPDSWLAWAQVAVTRPDFRTVRPQAVDWIADIALPVARNTRHDVWSVSSLLFPDPGVWVPNRGYRKDPNSGDLKGRAAAFPIPVTVGKTQPRHVESLYKPTEASNTIFRGMIYDLSGWYTPRIQWIVEFEPHQEHALARLLTLLAAVGVGRKTADGYGAVRDWTWTDTEEHPIWVDDNTSLRRPVPATSVPDWLGLPLYAYALQEARWLGVPTLCAGPSPEAWHPAPWTPEENTASFGKDDLDGNQT